jgi:hypothetical protein
VAKNDAAFDHRNHVNFPTVANWVIRTGEISDRNGIHFEAIGVADIPQRADRDRDA